MTKSPDCIDRLIKLGIGYQDALALRRISMTLHRWHELECGDGNESASWCITRGRKSNGSFEYDDGGAPFQEYHNNRNGHVYYAPIPDRERGAQKRLAKIMAQYPTLQAYIQGDPRGASLYIIESARLPADAKVDSCYSSFGIAVYK